MQTAPQIVVTRIYNQPRPYLSQATVRLCDQVDKALLA